MAEAPSIAGPAVLASRWSVGRTGGLEKETRSTVHLHLPYPLVALPRENAAMLCPLGRRSGETLRT
ncbi:MAG: hypothetical protein ACREJ3_18790 [Polyangiaceae bacterium]